MKNELEDFENFLYPDLESNASILAIETTMEWLEDHDMLMDKGLDFRLKFYRKYIRGKL